MTFSPLTLGEEDTLLALYAELRARRRPSMRELAEIRGVNASTVQRHLAKLEEFGLVGRAYAQRGYGMTGSGRKREAAIKRGRKKRGMA